MSNVSFSRLLHVVVAMIICFALAFLIGMEITGATVAIWLVISVAWAFISYRK